MRIRARARVATDDADHTTDGGAVHNKPSPNRSGLGYGYSFADLSVYAAASAAPVPDPLRAQFERVTGYSAATAQVHTDAVSERVADAMGARAFTIGRDIHFAAGEFRPGTADGDHLLAHELTHAVQQAAGPVPQMQLVDEEGGDEAEDEAEAVADAVLDDDDDEPEVVTIHARPPAIRLRRRQQAGKTKSKTAATKAAKPKPITFSLFKTKFAASVDAANNVAVKPAAKSAAGWFFTAAGANTVKAERQVDHAEYVHANGSRESFVQRCTVTVPAGGPAAVSPIVAELGTPSKLTVELSAEKRAAQRKPVTVNAVAIEQLELPAGAIKFTPADGDSIHLGLLGDAWVYTSIRQDVVPPAKTSTDVKGFFSVGRYTSYVDDGVLTFGVVSPSVSDADRIKAIDDLTKAPTPASRRITSSEAALFKTVTLIESDFAGVQTYDRGILSFGFVQWTVNASLPRMLLKVDKPTFERYLGRYGLAVGLPVRQTYAFIKKFIVPDPKLGIRNPDEGALFLDGKELVTAKLLTTASGRIPALNAFAKTAADAKAAVDAAKPGLASKDAATKTAAGKAMAAAKKKVDALRKQMAGLAGVRKAGDTSTQAALLAKVAADGVTAAQEIAANCRSSEVMRSEEWALRFQMLGKSAGGQSAEIEEVRQNWLDVSGKLAGPAALSTLLPNARGRAALLSSYINAPRSAERVSRAVGQFKTKKKAAAKAAAATAAQSKTPVPASTGTEADWEAFPWPVADARWTSLFTSSAIEELEAIAIIEVTARTTDPARRRKIIKSQFP